jgi:GTP-binding protein LepA
VPPRDTHFSTFNPKTEFHADTRKRGEIQIPVKRGAPFPTSASPRDNLFPLNSEFKLNSEFGIREVSMRLTLSAASSIVQHCARRVYLKATASVTAHPMPNSRIRNFCIIAHIDHGKTTLSDRLLEFTGTVEKRESQEQLLDAMDLERERGITIKSHPVAMTYTAKDGLEYKLNLMDTPGHVDFAYEVSRSLAACEGAIVVVDAAQGVEAQTVANVNLAVKQGLTIVPVINKIDLPNSDLPTVRKQLEEILAIPAEEAVLASAKVGIGITDVLEAVVQRIPAPTGASDARLRALVFDSTFDTYRGVVIYVRVVDGVVRQGDVIKLMATNRPYEVKEVGIFRPTQPKFVAQPELAAGSVGYVIANMKTSSEVKVGDTLTNSKFPADEPVPGFQEIQPMVFSGIYPINTADFEHLKAAMGKLQLNDAAFVFQAESSVALGFGFRCGFLGLLHMEIIQERLRREFDMDIIATYPSVIYEVYKTNGEMVLVDNPEHLPDGSVIEEIREPMVRCFLMIPNENISPIMQLILEKRGEVKHTESLDTRRVMLTTELPLNEILVDFVDRIKSITRGYGSMDYEHAEHRVSKLVKLDILVNGEPVDAFSSIVHRDKAESRGRALAAKLKEVIPSQMFTVPIQAAIGGKIVARETVSAQRKNVIAKCYGGDISRKRKLLEKQKEGKKRMKAIGRVNIPQEAFIEVLKTN